MGDWRHQAVCREEDPELFFPVGTSGPALLQVEQAKAVCRRCSVSDECLKWALESGQDAGVWGGMSEEERRALKRRRQARPTFNAAKTACLKGHRFDDANTYIDATGRRHCRACRREQMAARRPVAVEVSDAS